MATLLGLREQYHDSVSPQCLEPDVLEGIRQIAEEDLALVVEHAIERGDTRDAEPEALELELKRFLALALLTRKGIIDEESVGPTKLVDEVWHSFVLHTPEYTDFCDRVLGGYLHHVVATPRATGDEMRELLTRYFEGVDTDFIWDGDLFICWTEFRQPPEAAGRA